MDQNTVISLGKYLNNYIDPNRTCDRTLHNTIAWLQANHYDVDTELKWLASQGIKCDCAFIVDLYIPARIRMKYQAAANTA